jgi:hypothetical protein
MTDDALFRWELEHRAPPQGSIPCRLTEPIPEIAELAAAHPGHEIWAEQLPGQAQIKYVAQRRPGTSAQPYLIVTGDLAELRISSATVARLERQQRTRCRGRTLTRLAAALGEQPSRLVPAPESRTGTPRPESPPETPR